MKVSPFTYAKLFLGRYRSQVLMVILGLTMVIVGISTASPFDVITKYRTQDFKISMAALILIISGLAGILITLRTKRRTTVSAGIMSLGMVGYYFFFVAFMLPDVDEDDIMGFLKSLDRTKGEFYELIVSGEGEDDWQERTNQEYAFGWHLSSAVVFSFDGRPVK